MRTLALFASLILMGCDPKDDDVPIDADGDGHAVPADCDDSNPSIHPAATEICDGLDNNCDGSIDEGVTNTYFADYDFDGFGDASTPVQACSVGDGAVSNSTDCDDTNGMTYPGAAEICDGKDNNCDLRIDEGVTLTFYVDSDLDGFGDPENPIEACEPTEGIEEDGDDCDDTNSEIHPDASEICDDVDNNCDGRVDEDEALDARTWYADNDGDGYGDPTVTRFACDQPAGFIDNDDDCNDTSNQALPGGTEVCDELDNNCDGTVDEDTATDAPTWYADGDGDGYGVDDTSTNLVQCDAPSSGYAAASEDCNDGDSAINPGADELCSTVGIDDDCDESIDEGSAIDADTWYADTDEDGYGDADAPQNACEQPSGYLADDTDCDDTESTVNPAAPEYCDDEVDNDCDGSTDEDDAVDASIWYADTDEDGFGDADATTTSCTIPTGYVDDDTDCDDSEGTTYPRADEYCDEVDNDCDGTVDEDDAVDAITYYLDSDTDGYGDPASSVTACAAPGGYVEDDTDCDDTDSALNPDTEWFYDYDRDGYGSGTASFTRCEDPSTSSYAYSLYDTDCEAYDSSSYPGAPEACTSGCGEDGTDNDCDGDVDEGCPEIHWGTISADETWAAGDHYAVCSVEIYGGGSPTLTIEDGASVTFASGTLLRAGYYGNGDIVIEGTGTGVDFVSDDGAAGDWRGLRIWSNANSSDITGLSIQHGGSSSYYGNIELYQSDTNITDSYVADSEGHGIWVYDSSPTISGTTIENNALDGFRCLGSTRECLDTSTASFTDNTITGNTGSPVVLNANNVHALDATTTYSGNGSDEIEISGTNIDDSATWQHLDVPYYVTSDISVHNATNLPMLTLDDGVEIYFASGSGVTIGDASAGSIDINGSTLGVLMTAHSEDASAYTAADGYDCDGDWDGLYFGSSTSAATEIDGLTIRCGGGRASYRSNINIIRSAQEIPIRNSDISDSSSTGIYVYSNASGYTATLSITDSDIHHNGSYGVQLQNDHAEFGEPFERNDLYSNGDADVRLPADEVDNLATSSSYETLIDIDAATISESGTWYDLGVPFRALGTINVHHSTNRPVLTIEDGVELQFTTSSSFLTVGTTNPGQLIVNGDLTSGDGVLFTSSASTASAGDWGGVRFGSNNTGSSLSGLTIEGAGASSSYPAALHLSQSDLEIYDSVIQTNGRNGIRVQSYSASPASLVVHDTTIRDTTGSPGDGVYFFNPHASLDWSNNTVTNNDGYPATIYPTHMGDLDTASTYAGNGTDAILVNGGTATETATWEDLDVPWLLNGDIYVSSGTARPVITTSAEFQFSAGYRLQFGSGSNRGELHADGATFTSSAYATGGTPRAGDWAFLYFDNSSDGSYIQNSTFEYGGSSPSYGMVYLSGSSSNPSDVDLTDNVFDSSDSYGIVCYYRSSFHNGTISGNTFTNMATDDTLNCP